MKTKRLKDSFKNLEMFEKPNCIIVIHANFDDYHRNRTLFFPPFSPHFPTYCLLRFLNHKLNLFCNRFNYEDSRNITEPIHMMGMLNVECKAKANREGHQKFGKASSKL